MPTVTIHVASGGTQLSGGGTSNAGHMWYTLNNGAGSTSYGFGPPDSSSGFDRMWGPGEVYRNDDGHYLSTPGNPVYDRTIDISQAQYDAMRSFGDNPQSGGFNSSRYDVVRNSCVDFLWRALDQAGLNPEHYEGNLLPSGNIPDIAHLDPDGRGVVWIPGIDPHTLLPLPGAGGPAVPGGGIGGPGVGGTGNPGATTGGGTGSGTGGTGGGGGASGGTGAGGGGASGASGTMPPRRDPLVLDLDGDGIETTSTRSGTIVLFDHDGDGIKTGTGWVQPDDGWLVLDRNGNGTIDSGRELFGVDTIKSNGQLASEGFDALRDVDVNASGRIDSADAVFANLRIWRDLNQDGISQAGELTTLAANGITSIGVGSTAVRNDLGNGNIQTAAGTFTRSNGTTGTTGETDGTSANLDLLVNTFYRSFADAIPLTALARSLPTLRGSGRVRDLDEAISLSTTLGNWVQTYIQQTTRQGQLSLLDGFIDRWADTSDFQSLRSQADALAASGVTLTYYFSGLTAGTPAYDDFIRRLGVVERFMGFTYGGSGGQARQTPLNTTSGNLNVSFGAEQVNNILLAYERFRTDIYESLVTQTRLSSFTSILFTQCYGPSGFSVLEDAFKAAIAADSQQGIVDLIEFVSAIGEVNLTNSGWAGLGFLVSQLNASPDLTTFSEELSSWTARLAGTMEHTLNGTSRPDLIVGTNGNDTIQGFDGNDVLVGKGGSDYIDGGNGSDFISGGVGNDTLRGGGGNDRVHGGDDNNTLYGDAGNDTLFGFMGADFLSGGDGDDYLEGGQGNDTLNGGNGNDIYSFGRGDGQDVIASDVTDIAHSGRLQFLPGVIPSDVVVRRQTGSLTNLELTITATGDRISILNFFYRDDPNSGQNGVRQVEFANGTVWDLATLVSMALTTTSEADQIRGINTADTINGGAGDDTLNGANGDDSISGGNDNDQLFGETGNDTLIGGLGNDVLTGGTGDNTYVFGRGDGQDRVQVSYDTTVTRINTLEFLAGIMPSDIRVEQVMDDQYGVATGTGALRLSIIGTSDWITFNGFFYSNDPSNANNGLQQVRFSDGTVWDLGTIKAPLYIGTPGNDSLSGTEIAEIMTGSLGDDSLIGFGGNDILDGGYGRDTLNGGSGDDRYFLGRGTGRDTLIDTVGLDTVVFDASLLPSDVTLFRDGADLMIAMATTASQTRVLGQFGSATAIERMEFSNGTVWDAASIVSRTVSGSITSMTGTASSDLFIVDNTADSVIEAANGGVDTVQSSVSYTLGSNLENLTLTGYVDLNGSGNTLNNLITGNAGNNQLTGAGGNDTLAGGSGDDIYFVTGGTAGIYDLPSDLIVENVGEGQDRVVIVGAAEYNYALAPNIEELYVTGVNSGWTTFFGDYVYRTITGNANNNLIDFDALSVYGAILDGGAGADTLRGSAAADIYVVDNLGDTVDERGAPGSLNGPQDWVYSSVSYTLGSLLESLRLTGGGAIFGTGNAGNNTIDGSTNAAANVLSGGAGNDTYRVGAGDSVVELVGEGIDTVEFNFRPADSQLSIDAVLGSNIERFGVAVTAGAGLTLSGGALSDDLFYGGVTYDSFGVAIASGGTLRGLGGNDTLTGGGGSDRLDGGSGNDYLIGGAGDDTYVVDSLTDVINDSSGIDTIESSISWTLAADLENLTLVGTGATQAVGNAGSNRLDGSQNASANVLTGGAGDDVYVVGTGDTVVEGAAAGRDLTISSGALILASNVEDGTLTGIANVNLNGSSLANFLTGNAGSNVIDGGSGADTMLGGGGSDTFIVDEVGDVVLGDFGGIDSVQSTVSFTLGSWTDNLALTGSSSVNATGNTLSNTLLGNSAINILDGGAGNDNLDGGLGNDTYIFGRGYGLDVIAEATSDAAAGKLNTLLLGPGVLVADITLTRVGNDLELEIAGTPDKVTIRSFYLTNDPANAFNPVQQIRFADNTTWNIAAILAQVAVAASNPLNGTPGNDTLNGAGPNWTMYGGLGNDVYLVDGTGDVVVENLNEGTDRVDSSVSYTLDANVENLTLTGAAATSATGNALANTLVGNGGANRIDGGSGADTMNGGMGDDTYVVENAADLVSESASAGTDVIEASLSWTLAANVETLRLTGNANLSGTGNATPNTIFGNDGNNTLDGGIGTDTLIGGKGDDLYFVDAPNNGDIIVEAIGEGTDSVVSTADYTLSANVENLTLTGTATSATGNASANFLTGNAGNNTLTGGLGADTLRGGLGDDSYIIDDSNAVIIENVAEGTDIAQTNVSYILGANVENLMMYGGANLSATGNASNNVLTGNSGNNRLDGRGGVDTMIGGQGADTYVVDDINDVISEGPYADVDTAEASVSYALAAGVENLILTGGSSIDGSGNSLANVLQGNAAGNRLDGGAGNDTMQGGAGNDVYVVSETGDLVVEVAGEGIDRVESSLASYTLTANVENLTLMGFGTGIGNSSANRLVGSFANNVLDGGGGADTMVGNGGDDNYLVDDAGDVVVEAQNDGTDTITSSVGTTLSANVENLTLVGGGDIAGAGNELANVIFGNAGSNFLDGGAGADSMYGGLGNDTYVVDNAGDVAVEAANEGLDLVLSSVTIDLIGSYVENLTLTGSAAINGTGNQASNVIVGNAADNTIDGQGGADTMSGGAGNDSYVVDDVSDLVVEDFDGGNDSIRSGISYGLQTNVENLTLTGLADVDGTGNNLSNFVIGNSARNVLDGGAGSDTLSGGSGDDTYVVDSTGDVVIELLGEGTDLVRSSVAYTLGSEVENLTLTGTANISGTGNANVNFIAGNAGNNVINGGTGNDTMVGGLGDDVYYVEAINGGDLVVELTGEGIDSVLSSVTYELAANVENATLTGATAISLYGNNLSNLLIGNTANNVLDGYLGVDTMRGGTGNDTYTIDDVGDVVVEAVGEGSDTVQSYISYTLGTDVENLSLQGTGNFYGTGNSLANSITGNGGDNLLNGAGGADTFAGGGGNDTYVVDSSDDVIVEQSGIDLVLAGVSYTLGTGLENITLTGSAAISATGNSVANVLTGNAADNTLDGSTGADTLSGGLGNDTYVVDDLGDVIVEAPGAGTDLVMSSVDYVLGADLENLTLIGGSVISATGNAGDNSLVGNATTNYLDGMGGIDTLAGGQGSDFYTVDSTTDVLIENAGEGTDTVKTTVSFVLGNNFENLTLLGVGAINGTGNSVANVLVGNVADNVLDGGAGADNMAGGLGNDTYVVDAAGDFLTENAGAGTDLVQSSINWTLGLNFENLALTGTAANGTGNAAANVIMGNASNNRLDGGAGADTLTGGLGNDTYVIDVLSDVVTEVAGGGIDTVETALTYTLGVELENLLLTGSGNVNGIGNSTANALTGNVGNNVLDGGAGADTLSGGAGNDTYVIDDAGDLVIESAGAGTDVAQASVSYTLTSNVENVTLTGVAATDATGNTLANVLTGNAGDNVLDGGTGIDTMVGGMGNDTYVADSAGDVITEAASAGTDTVQTVLSWTLSANVENLVLTGSGSVDGTGNTLANSITGNSGANRIDGGSGADMMTGGAGNDTYVVDNVADTIIEVSGGGSDSVESSIAWTLGAELERLTLTGTGNLNGVGNALANTLNGNAGSNRLDGGAGIDTMTGGAGNDTYVVDTIGDSAVEVAAGGTDTVESSIAWTLGTELENLLLTGIAAVNGTGNGLANLLTGNAGDNVLNGGAGIDTMVGGLGNDTYVVDVLGDVTTEAASAGTDAVQSAITWTLGANIENLLITGTAAADGTGNSSANLITGNSGANRIDGATGADTMVGGAGNDTYVVDNALDLTTELASGGTDSVESSITWTLSTDTENLTLTGTAAINGTGNTVANILLGNAGANRLDGGTGADAMTGGAGNDIYVVDNAGDTTVEVVAGGTDSVESSVTWTLAAETENLTLTGTTAINGTGNAANNVLLGNVGNNRLDGGGGIDTMTGGAGNDTYVVDTVGDSAVEVAAAGTDTVESSISWTLGTELENLLLTGATTINATGNALANVLTGNSSDNILSGGAGIDTMVGGLGNDTYVVDDALDVVTEASSAGTDTIQTAIGYALGANLENLTLTGSSAVNGTGNTLSNVITGNSAANTLTGGAGNDTLDGGLAADTLIGGTGNDSYVIGRGYGGETIQENDSTLGNTDTLSFLSGVSVDQIWLQQLGNDLRVSIIGTNDTATVQNWYTGSPYHVEQFRTSDGRTLLDSSVQNLVSAMAAFAPPAFGQTTLPPSYQTSLSPVIAANWGP